MCGIAGFIDFKKYFSENVLRDIALRMSRALYHRGPDDGGIWVNTTEGIAFAHRRLSILDLSPLGHQPFVSEDGNFVLIYNGEIYNFHEIKQKLVEEGLDFKSSCDTEVLFKALLFWGIDKTLVTLNGMFAFAFLNRKEKKLTLIRDRLGVKPLYWALTKDSFFFASELKAFANEPSFASTISFDGLFNHLRFGFIPSPLTIYDNCYKLKPGTLLTLNLETKTYDEKAYWHIAPPLIGNNKEETLNNLHDLLQDAVKLRMISDVPLGSLLSGGIDSSLVTALMQNQSPNAINTFSIGFDQKGFNEAPFAEEIARHLGTSHTTLYVSPQDALSLILKLSEIYDEPFGDSSALPTLLLSKLTRQHVTVALTGDGGDEIFLGYNRYPWLQAIETLKRKPRFLKSILVQSLLFFSPDFYDKTSRFLRPKKSIPLLGDKIHKFAKSLLTEDLNDFYAQLYGQWTDTKAILSKGEAINLQKTDETSLLHQIQHLDLKYYLPDDILTKIDRATMAFSLEGRNPFLDYRVVSYAFAMPTSLKLNKGITKWCLKELLKRYIPESLFNRPKAGFAIPLNQWLKEELKEWAFDLLNSKKFKELDFIHHALITKTWNDFLKGRSEHMHRLWTILTFAQWINQK